VSCSTLCTPGTRDKKHFVGSPVVSNTGKEPFSTLSVQWNGTVSKAPRAPLATVRGGSCAKRTRAVCATIVIGREVHLDKAWAFASVRVLWSPCALSAARELDDSTGQLGPCTVIRPTLQSPGVHRPCLRDAKSPQGNQTRGLARHRELDSNVSAIATALPRHSRIDSMAPDTVVLKPVSDSVSCELVLPETRVFFVGRGRACGISASDRRVSREHCELYWKGRPVVHVTALKKRLTIQRESGGVCVVNPGSTGEVRALFRACQCVSHRCFASFPPLASIRQLVHMHDAIARPAKRPCREAAMSKSAPTKAQSLAQRRHKTTGMHKHLCVSLRETRLLPQMEKRCSHTMALNR
jgi:hypothetical protein